MPSNIRLQLKRRVRQTSREALELLNISIRPARIEDAPVLAHAERMIAVKPGFLASQPAELTDEQFAQKIAALRRADNGCYLVTEADGQLVGHGMLDQSPLAATRHVVALTLATHPGWQR